MYLWNYACYSCNLLNVGFLAYNMIIWLQQYLSIKFLDQAVSMSISKPIPLGYKEGFEDMDLDHNGKLDAKEVFHMMKKVSSLDLTLLGLKIYLC